MYAFERLLAFIVLAVAPMSAQRLPVLRQIDPTYGVYYREMYLPHLTSGPSSMAWLPDSQSVIFSMQGSLWRQSLASTTAEQLTNGPGYDYQPDVSSDGKWVIYSKYDHDAMELWLLDLATGQSKPLTKNGAVNLEPRWSPAFNGGDTRIVFVSTQFNQHFHIFVAQFDAAKQELKEVQRLTEEKRTTLPRAYDSLYDHEISPSWSPDGKEIIFVSNHNRRDGAGGFWRMKSTPVLVEAPPPVPRGPFGMMSRRLPPIVKEESRQIYDEKTTWRARPEWSPDGKSVLYAAYKWSPEGGEHQLSVMTSEGKDAALLSHSSGGYDDINPRWSPDAKSIAFVSNRKGSLSLWVQDAAGGSEREIVQKTRKFLSSTATIRLQGQGGDASGATGLVRVSITGADGRAYAPDHALVYSDDSFDRTERHFEAHYFDLKVSRLRPSEGIVVPPGKIHIELVHGFESLPVNVDVEVKAGETKAIPFTFQALHLRDDPAHRWIGGDTHVRLNYGGTYRSTAQIMLNQMGAEDTSVAYELTAVGQQFTGIAAPSITGETDLTLIATHHILNGRELYSNYWGDIGILSNSMPRVRRYASYPDPPVTGVFPANASIADLHHGKGALLGYTQSFSQIPDPGTDSKLTHELPIDVALGKMDYYEVMGSGDDKSSAAVWYKFLNLGFRLPAVAGSEAVAGFASTRGPVGLDRVYVRTPAGPFKLDTWLDGLTHGRSFATNGPLLRFTLGGQPIGGELRLPAHKNVKFTASLRSIVPVDHLEVVCNGEVAINVPMNRTHDASDAIGSLRLARSGWCLLRAWAEKAEGPVLDSYPYATTNPIYVTVGNAKPRSPEDAKYFLAWVDRVRDNAKANTGYSNEAQKAEVLKTIEAAHTVYDNLAK